MFFKKIGSLFLYLGTKGALNWIPDTIYLKIVYRIRTRRKLNLKTPTLYNEKIQWLKLYDRRLEYCTLVDKYEVKKYVARVIGEEYVIPTLGVWDDFEEIDFERLPERFVLKCTHDSGGVVICLDKKQFDKASAKKKLKKSLKYNYYYRGREWPYKNIKPRIIAEEYMEDKRTSELRDYKFFVFDGKAKILFVATDRLSKTEETKFDFFDMDYNHLEIINGYPNAKEPPRKPVCFDEMKKLAEKLSNGIPHVRVDFYEVDGKIYFGEMTLYHWSGMVPFEPQKWDEIFGAWIKLPAKGE